MPQMACQTWFGKNEKCQVEQFQPCIFEDALTYSLEQSPSEKLTDPQLAKKFFAFYGTRMFNTPFTSVRHLSLSWARTNPLKLSIPLHEDPF
jgi:hypothetical protein